MHQFSLFKPVLFCAITMAFALNVEASTLPPAYFEIDLSSGETPDGAIGLYSASYYAPGNYVLGAAAGSLVGFPSVAEYASVGGIAAAGDYLNYSFSVIGPSSAGGVIPVLVSGTLLIATDGGDAGAGAGLRVRTTLDEAEAGLATGGPDSWSGILHVNYADGTVGSVEESLYAGNPADTGSAEAYADPYIYVDPTFANASDYSVIVSDGIGNSPDAPEPASFTLIGIALLGAGLLRRRKLTRV